MLADRQNQSQSKTRGKLNSRVAMDVMSGSFASTLNPLAAPYVPTAYRAVEDFSDEWWGLVNSTPWFREYWMRECFQEPETDDLDIYDPDLDNTDSLFHSYPPPSQGAGQEKGVRGDKMEIVGFGAEKYRGPREVLVGPRYCEKAAKIVNVKVSPRMIQQPR